MPMHVYIFMRVRSDDRCPKITCEYIQSYWCIVVSGLQYNQSTGIHSFIVTP